MSRQRATGPGATVDIPIDKILKHVQAGVLDKALRGVAKAVLEEAKRNEAGRSSPYSKTKNAKKTGMLNESGKVKKSRYDKNALVVSFSDNKAHLIEHGHDVRHKDGRITGHAPAYPFLQPAVDTVMSRLPEEITKAIANAPDLMVGSE